VFHTVRPMNPAIIHAFTQFARLRLALPETPVVMVAGNHDKPRASESVCILRLFSQLSEFYVVDEEPRRIALPQYDLSILAVPDLLGAFPPLAPDPTARHNVLVLHGEIEGVLPAAAQTDRVSTSIAPELLHAPTWSYVALGHYHVHREIAPNAFYAGSLEYTSANPWGELLEERSGGLSGKGFVEYDLDARRLRFHAVTPARRHIDLPALSARGMTAAELDAAIAKCIEECEGGIDEQVVRLVVRDVPRHIARELDHKALRDAKRRALHFHLDTRRPDIIRSAASGGPGRRTTLPQQVQEYLEHRRLEGDIDRAALVALGLQYLAEADAADASAQAVDGVGV